MVIALPFVIARAPVSGQKHQLEPIRNFVDAIFDGDASHGLNLPLVKFRRSMRRKGARTTVRDSLSAPR